MKKKFSKILGVGLTLVLVFALTAGFSLPVGASPDENEWSTFDYPAEGEDGGWFYEPTIAGITAIDLAINGDLYAYEAGLGDIFVSTDGGRSWAQTDYFADTADADPVIDIACSSIDEETVYVTEGDLVYKTEDAGDEWAAVADTSLEALIGVGSNEISCLDVGYDRNDDPIVFIGTTGASRGVYYIAEEEYPSVWTDLHLDTGYGVNYEVMSLGVSPEFATTDQILAVVTMAGDTDVVSNTGTVADWDQVSDVIATVITGASNICFPPDYDDTETVFIGIEEAGALGDVYNVTDIALDLDVAGTGTDTDVVGLDILGETDEAKLVAGADDAMVYYSTDGGWDWDETDKVPSGATDALIVLSGDSVFAATSGAECALSLSVDDGALFNQISLIATDIDVVTGVALSSAYAEDETMFLLTRDTATNIDSLLRHDGINWERVAETTVIGAGAVIGMVAISPDYPTDNTVFLGDTATPEMFYSNDAGNEWDDMRYDPDYAITTWLIIDGDTLIVGGHDGVDGVLQMTTRSGSRPWEDAEKVAAGAGAITSIAKSGDQLLVGDMLAQVFISPDGELDEFEQVDTVAIGPAGWTAVGFGSDILYATSGAVVARCVIDPDEDWEDQAWEDIATPETTTTQTVGADAFTIACVAPNATGVVDITEPAGWSQISVVVTADVGLLGAVTVVYNPATSTWRVTLPDPGDTVTVTAVNTTFMSAMGSIHNVAGDANVVIALVADADGDALIPVGAHNAPFGLPGPPVSYVLPDVEEVTADVVTPGLQAASGLVAYPAGSLYVTDNTASVGMWRSLNPNEEDVDDVVFEAVTAELDATAALWLWGFTVGSYVVWAPDTAVTTNLWTYEDTLNTEVILKSPVSGMSVDETDEATLEWFELTGADEYEIAVNTTEDFDGTDVSPDDTDELEVTVDGLDAGTTYYWKVRAAEGEPVLSRWSEVRSFITELEPVELPPIWVPEVGETDVSLSPTFMWTVVDGATSYKIIVATEPDFAVASRIAEEMITTNSYVCDADLDYSTTYYWRVKAFSDSVVVSEWTSGMFTTMAKPVPPTPPVEVTPAPPAPEIEVEVPPPQVIEVPPAQVISPTWIYVIIGVGALLVIAVIVLIVRTRRVS